MSDRSPKVVDDSISVSRVNGRSGGKVPVYIGGPLEMIGFERFINGMGAGCELTSQRCNIMAASAKNFAPAHDVRAV